MKTWKATAIYFKVKNTWTFNGLHRTVYLKWFFFCKEIKHFSHKWKKLPRANIWEVHKESFSSKAHVEKRPSQAWSGMTQSFTEEIASWGKRDTHVQATVWASEATFSSVHMQGLIHPPGVTTAPEVPRSIPRPSLCTSGLVSCCSHDSGPVAGPAVCWVLVWRSAYSALEVSLGNTETPHTRPALFRGDWVCGQLLLLGEGTTCDCLFSHLKIKAKPKNISGELPWPRFLTFLN